MECLMHLYDREDTKMITLHEKSWRKFVNCSLMWINFEGRESAIAQTAVQKYNLGEGSTIPDIPADVGYHRECYSVYTNISNIERACKREDKKIQKIREKLEAYQRSDGCGDMVSPQGNTKINIGSAFTRWCLLKEVKKLKSHAEVATFLLDRYDQSVTPVTSPPVTSPPVTSKPVTRRKSKVMAAPDLQPVSQSQFHPDLQLYPVVQIHRLQPDPRIPSCSTVSRHHPQQIGETEFTTVVIDSAYLARRREDDLKGLMVKEKERAISSEDDGGYGDYEPVEEAIGGSLSDFQPVAPPTSCHPPREECVLCRKVRYKRGLLRSRVKLSKCRKLDALLQAADKKSDEEMLIRLRGRDLEASEINYHRECYLKYVKCIGRRKPQKKNSAVPDVSFPECPQEPPVRPRRAVSNNTTIDSEWTKPFSSDGDVSSKDDDASDWAKSDLSDEVSSGEFEGRNKEKLTCEQCGKAFSCQSALVIHTRVHTGERPFQCESCDKAFKNKRTLVIHTRIHTGEKPFQCEECGEAFISQRVLDKHRRGHMEERPYQCQECGKRCKSQSTLDTHTRVHTGEKPFICEACGKGYISQSTLDAHSKEHTEEKPFQCEVCGKAFRLQNALASHAITHTEERPFQCDVCEKGFKGKSALVTHRRVHTGEKPFVCGQCGEAFRRRDSFIVHKRGHSGERPYQCEHCGKDFVSYTRLYMHKITHTDKRPHQCQDCGKAFRGTGGLKKHMMMHTGERPHQCDLCDKAYRTKSELVSHQRTHTGEKPFHCLHCKKTFRDRDQLKSHSTVHTGEKPFQCNICGKTFRVLYTLTVHKRTHLKERAGPTQERNYITGDGSYIMEEAYIPVEDQLEYQLDSI